MAKNPKILSIVLAGGEGTRLMPLTRDRAKPAVPFGGVFRLIDFPLSNLVNSGYMQTVVLTQYKSHSLDRHISTVWRFSPLLGNYVSPVPAQQRLGKHWYLGSADAIYQTINIIEDVQPDIVVIVGADHVYRMDFQQMVQQHIESGAEFTVAGIRQPISQSNQFGVIEVDPDHPNMIKSFQEKPQTTTGLPDDPNSILASMGNYVANTDALFAALSLDEKAEDTKHDMGGDIAPYFAARNEAGVYDFNSNEIPGATPTDHAYWRDVGTLKQFYDAHMDLISYVPEFNLYNTEWPIYTLSGNLPPAKFVHAGRDRLKASPWCRRVPWSTTDIRRNTKGALPRSGGAPFVCCSVFLTFGGCGSLHGNRSKRQYFGRLSKLKPSAASWSRPSGVILSIVQRGCQVQSMRNSSTRPARVLAHSSSIRSVSGQAGVVSVIVMMARPSSSISMP